MNIFPFFAIITSLLIGLPSIVIAKKKGYNPYLGVEKLGLQKELIPEFTKDIKLPTTTQTGRSGIYTISVRSTKPIKLTPVQDGWIEFKVNLGTQSEVTCQITHETMGLSVVAMSLLDNIFSQYPVPTPPMIEVGYSGKAAYIGTNLYYVDKSPEGDAIADFKFFAAALPNDTLYCYMDEVGYRKTFWTFTKRLLRSIRVKPTKDDGSLNRREIYFTYVNGIKQGIRDQRIYGKDTAYGNVELNINSMFLRGPKNQLKGTEEIHSRTLDYSGNIAEGDFTKYFNTGVASSIKYKVINNTVKLTGNYRNKQLTLNLSYKGQIFGKLKQENFYEKALKKKKSSKAVAYLPEINPIKVSKITIKPSKGKLKLKIDKKISQTLTIGSKGNITRTSWKIGKLKIDVKKLKMKKKNSAQKIKSKTKNQEPG